MGISWEPSPSGGFFADAEKFDLVIDPVDINPDGSGTYYIQVADIERQITASSADDAKAQCVRFAREMLSAALAVLGPPAPPSRYIPLMWPADRVIFPEGVKWTYVEYPAGAPCLPPTMESRHQFGIIETNRPLTELEQARLDLVPLEAVDRDP